MCYRFFLNISTRRHEYRRYRRAHGVHRIRDVVAGSKDLVQFASLANPSSQALLAQPLLAPLTALYSFEREVASRIES